VRTTAFIRPSWDRKPPTVTTRLVAVPGVVDLTVERLRAAGNREAIVLWAGRPDGSDATHVTHVIVPSTLAGEGWIQLDSSARLEVVSFLRAENLLVVADVHTHPQEAFLSRIDERHPYSRRTGHVAIVVPFFARADGIASWRAYEFRRDEWRERPILEVIIERGE